MAADRAGRFAGWLQDMQKGQDAFASHRRNELAPGLQFGSRESVSALNRAIYANTASKEEQQIVKNTAAAAAGIDRVVRGVEKIANAGLAIVAGSPIP